jgi:hypothetical protein
MTHRITEELIAWDAAATLQEWFDGYMTMDDGRQYKVVQVGSEDTRLTVRVEGSRYLDVMEEEFEIEVRVKRVEP